MEIVNILTFEEFKTFVRYYVAADVVGSLRLLIGKIENREIVLSINVYKLYTILDIDVYICSDIGQVKEFHVSKELAEIDYAEYAKTILQMLRDVYEKYADEILIYEKIQHQLKEMMTFNGE